MKRQLSIRFYILNDFSESNCIDRSTGIGKTKYSRDMR